MVPAQQVGMFLSRMSLAQQPVNTHIERFVEADSRLPFCEEKQAYPIPLFQTLIHRWR